MVIFTVSSYSNTAIMHFDDYENVNLNISFNIQGAILLADPDPTTDGIIAEAAEPVGILPDPEEDSSQTAASTSEEEETV
jgi:hypothetical protein